MDETALLVMGLLLEEAAVEVLGETGDMVQSEGLENTVPEERITRYQIRHEASATRGKKRGRPRISTSRS